MGTRRQRSVALAVSLLIETVSSWILPLPTRALRKRTPVCRKSTPFEADFYDNPFDDATKSSLAVPPYTRLILGINKYSHDTTLCAADADTGKVLFALSKERISRRKHDSGNVASLTETCLEALNLELENIQKVVVNNHHHRVLLQEENTRQVEWETGLQINQGAEDGYDEPENLFPDTAEKHELSHHLAHAYSTATQAPFDAGLCVVMDGMGETYRTMQDAVERNDLQYTSDLSFGLDSFHCIPSDIVERAAKSRFDWREAESVYVFSKNETSIDLRPIFKRFTAEHSPPALYNHGFENMDSAGAVYSRASSHIFGDWNACGKVMGLAPWAAHKWRVENGKEIQPLLHDTPIMSGRLYSEENDECFTIDRSLMEGIPHIARNDPDLFNSDGTQKKRYDFDDNIIDAASETNATRIPVQVALEAIALAHRVQIDLEAVVMDFVSHFKDKTGQTNLCLAGGVALNSVLNGRLARELGFERTFISPYPGDDGIAVGCCAFGLFGNSYLDRGRVAADSRPPVWSGPVSAYLGPEPSELVIKNAIEEAQPWLEVEAIRNEDARLRVMAEEVESGGVIAWYRSRSELGPRALGHRSILADPRKKGLVRFINEFVKRRESFRPFAPSVLAEEAASWFDLGENLSDPNVSPYMSMTAMVHEDKRAPLPAVTHVDGSSRLQTVTKEAEPLYHKFISKFFELTGIPMVLNTSFNTLPSEPIVESPSDAIRSFLYSMGAIEMLVMGDYIIKRKQPDLRRLLGEVSKDGDLKIEPACPKRAGRATFHSSFEIEAGRTDEESVQVHTMKVRMPDRPMHGLKNEWFELLDELEGELLSACDGSVSLNDIMAEYTSTSEGESLGEQELEEAQALLQNFVHRLVRLHEYTLISW